MAIKFKPGPTDEFRKVWNIYHHFLGYALLALIYINIFEGLKILKPENKEKWKYAVIGILIALGLITLVLEVHTWRKFIKERTAMKNESQFLNQPKANQQQQEEDGSGTITTQSPPFSRRNSPSTPTLIE